MADVLSEWDLAVSDDERAAMLALADRMNISERIRRVLDSVPSLIGSLAPYCQLGKSVAL
jgi:hypothetical protein